MRFIDDYATVLENDQEFIEAYLDYVNNFLTVSRFAEYYGWTDAEAENAITYGRQLHEASVAANR